MGKRSSVFRKEHLLNSVVIKAFKRSHEAHYRSLAAIEKVLARNGVRYHKRCRGGRVDYSKYDAVITVGGDGTFLEAARGLTSQVIFGVNSDPQSSVGRFCSTNALDFESALNRFLSGTYKVKTFQRLRVTVESAAQKYEFNVLNDLLVCHQNPAALSRYYLLVNGEKEDQRSSGIWIATAAGSSGAIHSSGARILPDESKVIQYQPRELYAGRDRHYHLKGGDLLLNQPIEVTSLMRSGTVYIDGAHLKLPFNFGARLKVSYSKYPLKVVSFS